MKTKNSIKIFFNKNYEYVLGSTIGFLIGIFPFVQSFAHNLNGILLFIPRQIIYTIFKDCILCSVIFTGIVLIIVSILLYTLLGLFIAFLFRKIKHNKKPRKNK